MRELAKDFKKTSREFRRDIKINNIVFLMLLISVILIYIWTNTSPILLLIGFYIGFIISNWLYGGLLKSKDSLTYNSLLFVDEVVNKINGKKRNGKGKIKVSGSFKKKKGGIEK